MAGDGGFLAAIAALETGVQSAMMAPLKAGGITPPPPPPGLAQLLLQVKPPGAKGQTGVLESVQLNPAFQSAPIAAQQVYPVQLPGQHVVEMPPVEEGHGGYRALQLGGYRALE